MSIDILLNNIATNLGQNTVTFQQYTHVLAGHGRKLGCMVHVCPNPIVSSNWVLIRFVFQL